MAGGVRGVGPRIEQMCPKALHLWCASHQLNLVIVSSCTLPLIRNMMGTTDQVCGVINECNILILDVHRLCVFFKFSSKREKCLMDIVNDDDEEGSSRLSGKNKLNEFCHTRWVERHELSLYSLSCFQT